MAIKVLIVDDSVFMRSMLKGALSGAPGVEVIGTAQNGNEGFEKIKSLKPDVVTLDVEMPGMDGLEVLRRVMADKPLPVIMVSTKTQKGAQATLEALKIGAVDCVAKPLGEKSATLETFRSAVIQAVETAAASNRSKLGKASSTPVAKPRALAGVPSDLVVAIGISAGGPATLHEMIPSLPKQFPPVVLTQHMPADFTGPFAKRLNEESNLTIMEASEGCPLLPGTLYIAPGDQHMRIKRVGAKMVTTLDRGPKVVGFRPSVDVLFESVAQTAGARVVAVVMTGMGCDGSNGVRMIKKAGGLTIAQDRESSIVYGMPKAAAETGCIDQVLPLDRIPEGITSMIHQISTGQHEPAHSG